MIRKILLLLGIILISSLSLFSDERPKMERNSKPKITVNKPTTKKSNNKVNTKSNNKSKNSISSKSSKSGKNKKQKKVFSISSTYESFSALGGSRTFTVNSSDSWFIDVNTASWCKLKRSGNNLYLNVTENENTTSRNDYFVIKSGTKTIQININQAANLNKLRIEQGSIQFSAKGGTESLAVSSNNRQIDVDSMPSDWLRVRVRGNNLIISATENKEARVRSTSFWVYAGNQKGKVEISQRAAPRILEASSDYLTFSKNGGNKTIDIICNDEWNIDTVSSSWIKAKQNGSKLSVNISRNEANVNRTGEIYILSGDKEIPITVKQNAALEITDSDGNSLSYFSSGGGDKTYIVKNADNGFKVSGIPNWCKLTKKNDDTFVLSLNRNNSSKSREKSIRINSGEEESYINIYQDYDYDKHKRRIRGGYINMSLGFEGGYGIDSDNTWYANGIIGLRIGNYGDVLQLELGASPGIINYKNENTIFHLPLYSSLKLSVNRGGFYLKVGGAYNIIRNESYEGPYSLRAGFGSAWKHFEWDWVYAQVNAPTYKLDKIFDIFDYKNLFVGMRMAFYITR